MNQLSVAEPVESSLQAPQVAGNEELVLSRLRADLVEAREKSLRASSAQSEFISNMSHELRTPMNAVIGMAEALWETDLSSEQRKLLSVLMNGGKSLLRIINDVLELARLEEGKIDLDCASFKVQEPVRRAAKQMERAAQQKGLALRVDTSTVHDSLVKGDAQKIEQILLNLASNAVKFTERGEVSISVERKNCLLKPQLIFTVKDTGIGIDGDAQAELFRRFSQADMSVTKTFGGSGLGLALSKQLVEIMGGEISVSSQKDQGSTFRFTVPVSFLDQAESKASLIKAGLEANNRPLSIEEQLAGKRILVVEDSADNAFLIRTFLRKYGCSLEFAENGAIAIDRYEQGVFDLILMDVQMPEMDGYSATRWIRMLELTGRLRTPIVALTAYAFAEQVKKSLDAGCDAHLTKPFDKKTLIETIIAFART